MRKIRPFKVLSIDFDYFANVEPTTIARYYPDGVDLTTRLSEFVWASRYQKFNRDQYDRITGISVNQDLLNTLEDCLARLSSRTHCTVCQSHANIYSEITERVSKYNDKHPDELCVPEIHHIDFHHDVMNDCKEPDCGNWLGYLLKEIPHTKAVWYARKESFEAYKVPPEAESAFSEVIIDDLSAILEERFDYIFVCRSDAWLPPHLDEDFDDLVDFCAELFYNGNSTIEVCVTKPRDMQRIYQNAAEMDKQYEIIMKEQGLSYEEGEPK